MVAAQNARRFEFRPDWRLTALLALVLALLLTLGFWQLSRAEEKRQLLQRHEQRLAEAPRPLETFGMEAAPADTRVSVSGHYLNDTTVLLDNRIHNGRFGYEVVTPLRRRDGSLVLINRGWIAADRARRTLPAVPEVQEPVRLEARVYAADGQLLRLGDEAGADDASWPRVRQSLDIPALERELQTPVWPRELRLAPDQPGVLTRNWSVVNMQPEKHTGYAVQWFAMSAALVLLWLHLSSNLFSRAGRGEHR